MSFLVIQDNQKEDLKFLEQQSSKVLVDFCKLTWDFLANGPNIKVYQAVSQKINADVKQIQAAVEGLAYFFIEASQNELNEQGFREQVLKLDFTEEAFHTLYNEYTNQKELLERALTFADMQHLEFKNLEWRFETQVASRAMKNQLEPKILLKFDLAKGEEVESVCLESNIPNLVHLNQMLTQALEESKSQHSKRIHRALS